MARIHLSSDITLYNSVCNKLMALPDETLVYPARGADGMCGKSLNSTVACRPFVVHCQSGYRSSIAVSLLERRRFEDVTDLAGGFAAWEAPNLPVSGSSAGKGVGCS